MKEKVNETETRTEARMFKLEVKVWQREVLLVVGPIERCLVLLYKKLRRNAWSIDCLKISFGRELIRLENEGIKHSFSFSDGLRQVFIVMPYFDPNCASDIADLAHECLHVADYVLREEGVNDGRKVDGAFAYTQSFVLLNLLKMVFEQCGKKCGIAGCDKADCVCTQKKLIVDDEVATQKDVEIGIAAKKLSSYGRRRIAKNGVCMWQWRDEVSSSAFSKPKGAHEVANIRW